VAARRQISSRRDGCAERSERSDACRTGGACRTGDQGEFTAEMRWASHFAASVAMCPASNPKIVCGVFRGRIGQMGQMGAFTQNGGLTLARPWWYLATFTLKGLGELMKSSKMLAAARAALINFLKSLQSIKDR